MKLLFLDIDKVLNNGRPQWNGYCGMERDKVERLNRILRQCPEVQIVLSSAWRYCVHNGWSNLAGLEHLMLTHGIDCKGRLRGVTEPDPETFKASDHEGPFNGGYWEERGLKWRRDQIGCYLADFRRRWADVDYPEDRFVVLDDLPLDMPELVQTVTRAHSIRLGGLEVTDPTKVMFGLTDAHADEVIRRLNG